MGSRDVIWLPIVREKLSELRSEYFTPEETLDFITQFILETEEFLKNDIVSQTYKEEFGVYRGLSRIVIRKFRIYYKNDRGNIIILAVLLPGEK